MTYSLLLSGGIKGLTGGPIVLPVILAVAVSTAVYIIRKMMQNRKKTDGDAFAETHYLPDDPEVFRAPDTDISDMHKYICRQCGFVSFDEITYCPECGCCDVASFPPGAKPDNMHLFCPRCGTLVRSTDRFCFRCGTAMQ